MFQLALTPDPENLVLPCLEPDAGFEGRGLTQQKFLKQAQREYIPGKHIIALMLEGILFLGILSAIVYFSQLLGHQSELPRFAYGAVNVIIGCVFIIAGILFARWSIYVQFTIGRGIPAPLWLLRN